ncbi:32704_t:CDS:2, partial [Racocetra persica]
MKDGTKKLLLHDGTMPDGSKHIMTYIDNANVKRPKRIKQPDPNNPNCCALHILSVQPDFAAQRSRIRE